MSNKRGAACASVDAFCAMGLDIVTLGINKSPQGPSPAKIRSRKKGRQRSGSRTRPLWLLKIPIYAQAGLKTDDNMHRNANVE